MQDELKQNKHNSTLLIDTSIENSNLDYLNNMEYKPNNKLEGLAE